MGRVGRTWTSEEDATLLDRRDNRGWKWADIGREIGVTGRQCEHRYWNIQARRRTATVGPSIPAKQLSNKALIDRERRMTARDARDFAALLRGDITPVFFGDPPPGFSALDKARAHA